MSKVGDLLLSINCLLTKSSYLFKKAHTVDSFLSSQHPMSLFEAPKSCAPTTHPFWNSVNSVFFLLAVASATAGVAIVSCKSNGRGTSTDDMLLAIDVCKSLDTARSSNPSPLSIIGSARCMSYNMSYDMSYPENSALHNMQGGSQILSPSHCMYIQLGGKKLRTLHKRA